jgi:integrase
MSYFVRGGGAMQTDRGRRSRGDASSLYRSGSRKYVNSDERRRIARVTEELPTEHALFVMTLLWTGARICEVLAVCPASFQIERSIVAFETLKRRRSSTREVPIPPGLMSAMDQCFDIAAAQRDVGKASLALWPWCRTTAWLRVKDVMMRAGVTGIAACPRGLRHGFCIGTLQAGVPMNLVQRWMGHASMSTTAIYAAASGPEEIEFAARFWQLGEASREAAHASS